MAKRYDETPVHVADVILMTGEVLEKRRQESRGGESLPADDSDLLVAELDTDSTAGGDRRPPPSSDELFGKRLSDSWRRPLWW